MSLNSIGSIRKSQLRAVALATVLALSAGVAATGMTRRGEPDPALAIARIAAPNAEGTVPPHTIGLTADYFAAIGISGQRDPSPPADAKTFTAPPATPAPERLARRRAAPDESGRAKACGDSSVSLAAAKSPPTTES